MLKTPDHVLHINPSLFQSPMPKELRVHSVFEKAMNLEWEDTLYTVSSQLSQGNHTILLSPVDAFNVWLNPSSTVVLNLDSLTLGARRFAIPETSKNSIDLWEKTYTPTCLTLKLCATIEQMIKEKRTISVFYFDKNEPLLASQMTQILTFLKTPSSMNALAILGLGPGLTPLGDDVLFGHVLAAHALGHSYEYLSDIADHLMQTSSISKNLLRDVLNRDLTLFYQTFLDNFFEHNNLDAVEEILNFGATSGAGILTGFIYSIQFLTQGGPYHD